MPVQFADEHTHENEVSGPRGKLFGRERSIHEVLGGGQVADLLLWRNRNFSAGLFIGISVIWFLFEVVEYNFVTLLCHLSITTMLVFFIYCAGADIFKWGPPHLPEIILQESAFKEFALTFHRRFNHYLVKLVDIASGRDVPHFILTIVCLYILSVIGTYFSFLNFLYLGFVCLQTLPIIYERFEDDVDRLIGHLVQEVKKLYRRFDSNFLNKIPRGPVKEKKLR